MKGASIDSATPGGGTPLFVSCEAGHVECVKLLLARGADTSLAPSGLSPIGVAQANGHTACVTALVSAEAAARRAAEAAAAESQRLFTWVATALREVDEVFTQVVGQDEDLALAAAETDGLPRAEAGKRLRKLRRLKAALEAQGEEGLRAAAKEMANDELTA